jgi:Ca2+/Na+ antiporter
MEIYGKNDVTIENIKVSKEYKTMSIVHFVCAAIAVAMFALIANDIKFVILFAVAFISAMFMYWSYNNLQAKSYELDDCYIKVINDYLEFKQLVDEQYQIGKINLNDITRVMKVNEGFQIWYDASSGNSRFMLDEDVVEVDTICINFYGFDTDEYIDVYLHFLEQLDDSVEKDLETASWKERSDKKVWIKLFAPGLLYIAFIVAMVFI